MVGEVRLIYPGSYDVSLATLLWDRLAVAAAAAVAGAASIGLGVGVALVAGRRVTQPLRVLAAAVRSVNEGQTDVRVGRLTTDLELESLAAGVDDLAATLEHQETLRRNLVADVAHELRTPVSVVQAGCEAILDGMTRPTRGVAASMLEEVHRLGRRIADLESLVAAETADLRLARRPVALATVASNAAQTTRGAFADAGVSFDSDLRPCLVEGDPDRLDQVVTNLLTNAVGTAPRSPSASRRCRRRYHPWATAPLSRRLDRHCRHCRRGTLGGPRPTRSCITAATGGRTATPRHRETQSICICSTPNLNMRRIACGGRLFEPAERMEARTAVGQPERTGKPRCGCSRV
ncbi:MAG: sensor histidine kinase [Acidimicrobiales bacterium]